jgi:cytochrome c-type biogenesis protein CcmH/NrfG
MSNYFKLLLKALPVIIALSLSSCAVTGSKAKRISSEKKSNPEVMSHIINGAIADLVGDSKEALLEYHQAAELDTTSAGIYLALAEDYYYTENYSNALRLAQKALRVDPDNIDALELMAVTYEKTGDFANAMTTFKRIVKNEPDDLEYLFNLVTLEIIAGDFKQAVKDYSVMVKKGLEDIEYRLRIGHMFLQHKAYTEA